MKWERELERIYGQNAASVSVAIEKLNKLISVFMKVIDLIKLVEKDGWYLARQRGSHRQFKHPHKSGLVTIAGHKLSDEVEKGTLSSVLKQTEIKPE
ncbi:MAG TPA: type II toxin-antitoxin system HicA family toxin [Bacteroidales bacterium]|nr:type II toxin-antitoxin system HicA family toxin [Bacteroidales bacterium]